jgi:hypothetical protein
LKIIIKFENSVENFVKQFFTPNSKVITFLFTFITCAFFLSNKHLIQNQILNIIWVFEYFWLALKIHVSLLFEPKRDLKMLNTRRYQPVSYQTQTRVWNISSPLILVRIKKCSLNRFLLFVRISFYRHLKLDFQLFFEFCSSIEMCQKLFEKWYPIVFKHEMPFVYHFIKLTKKTLFRINCLSFKLI